MKQVILTALTLILSVAMVFAQDNCPPIDEALLEALDNCDEMAEGTVCYGAGDIAVEHDTEEADFEASGDTVFLQDVIALETTFDADDNAIAILNLNREDVRLRLIAYGDSRLENVAPRTSISIYTLRGVNVRTDPSLDASVISSLLQGRDYTAIGRLADNTWIQVMLEDGRVGWSSAQYFVTQDSFTDLEAVTPTTPPYLPMQAFTLSTGDCGGLLLIAPELEEETIIFGINGAQIQVTGIVWVSANDELLEILSIDGEHIVNAFGFEIDIASGEQTSIPLSETGSLAGIPSDTEERESDLLGDETVEVLTAQPLP